MQKNFKNNFIKRIAESQRFNEINRSDFRALLLLSIVGFVVGIFWWINATLVYDDIAFPANFSGLVNSIGWFKSLIKIFVLDLPNEYRTYGLSRVIQFFLWSLSGSSIGVYTLLISLSQLATALILYILLKISLKFERITAFSMGLMWLLSPFIWTSCFHHYSYLILPIQITIIGSFFLITITNPAKLKTMAVLLGIAIALTGELHLIAAPFILIMVALASGKRSSLRASFLAIVSMVMTIIIHHSIWKMFAADRINNQRFTLSLSHDASFWIYRFFVATRGIGRSAIEQISLIAGHDAIWLAIVTSFSASALFICLSWITDKSNKENLQIEKPQCGCQRLLVALFVSSFLYLLTFVTVVILTDSVPSSMPRRYGYIPLTVILLALVFTISTFSSHKLYKKIVLSILIGSMITLFIRQQGVLIPEERRTDNRLSKMMQISISKYPTKPVLFFNSSKNEFPLATLDDTLGIAMRDVISAEVVQAKYSTYWPSYINTTKILGAPYTCGLGNIQKNGLIQLACPSWQANPGIIDSSQAIVVANLGFDKYDPLGKNVRVFDNFADFEPYFFSKRIIDSTDPSSLPQDNFFTIDFSKFLSENNNNTPNNKEFDTPLSSSLQPWIKNYGWRSVLDHSIEPDESDKIYLDYAFDFRPSDMDAYLDFQGKSDQPSKNEIFDIQVSWNEGPWVSLGKINVAQQNGGKPFSIMLSHLDTNAFEFRLITASEEQHDLPLQSIRIAKRESPDPSYSFINSAADLLGDWGAGDGTAKIYTDDAGNLILTDEKGNRVSADIEDGQISVPGWNVSGKLTEDLEYIHWSNGFKWNRSL